MTDIGFDREDWDLLFMGVICLIFSILMFAFVISLAYETWAI